MRVVPLGITALALSAGLAACGGDSGLSASELKKQANAICTRGDDDLVEAGKKLVAEAGGQQPSVDAVVAFFKDEALPIAKKKLDDLEKLDVSGDRKDQVEDLVAAGRDAIEEVETGLTEDGAAFLSSKGPDPFADFNAQAREMDLDQCAGESATPTTDSTDTTATTGGGDATTTTTAGG